MRNTATAATGLQMMYYALCAMVLCIIAMLGWPFFLPLLEMNVFQFAEILVYITYIFFASEIIYTIGAFMCLSIAKESPAGNFLYASLGLWSVALVITVIGFVQLVPIWVESARLFLNMISFVLFLMFLRVLDEVVGDKKLVRRAKNTFQVCVAMIFLWGVFVALMIVDPLIVVMIGILSIALAVGALIAFIMYANLLLYTSKALKLTERRPVMIE